MKKLAWIFVSCVMALSLVVASCTTDSDDKTISEDTDTVKITETTSTETTISTTQKEGDQVNTSQNPEYGGILTLARSTDVATFDEIYGWHIGVYTMHFTNEELWTGDWTKGAAGTGETEWAIPAIDRWDTKASALAESWDFSQLAEGIMIFNIRKGVHWALNTDSEASRLVGGRELVAEDVVFSLKRLISDPRSFIYAAAPNLRNAVITAPDTHTLKIEVSPDSVEAALGRFGDFAFIIPPEIIEHYGNMNDWRQSVGTGAFMLKDLLPGSTITFTKNPNYWQSNPIGPGKGDQLPYLDKVRVLIIPDTSSQQAALRTGRVDILRELDQDAAGQMARTTPDLLEKKYWMEGGWATGMRTDKPPFNDIRVRKAMMMATDFEIIKNDLYDGYAQILTFPIPEIKDYSDAYLGLDDPEMPESVREQYVYNPEKAKKLLAEAGYPDGFKTSIIIGREHADYYSVIKEMWSKIGIDLELQAFESSVWNSMIRNREYDQMAHQSTGGVGSLYRCGQFTGESWTNCSFVNDSVANEGRLKIMELISRGDQSGADKLYKELMKYVLDQAWAIPFPNLMRSAFWWPWVNNYHGEFGMGYYNWDTYTKYVWIDQDLKQN